MFFGLPWKIARNLFHILQQGRHHIKTGYSVLEPMYGNEEEKEPIAGIGECNEMGPSLWCLINTVIIKTCKRKGHGTTIRTQISKKIVSLLGFVFVDNANLVIAVKNAYTSGVAMIQKMQALMTGWCGCIWATGEYIAPAKTRWFLISLFWMGTVVDSSSLPVDELHTASFKKAML